jgi:signal transduction histidine kinase
LPHRSILNNTPRAHWNENGTAAVCAGAIVIVWYVVWYLVSSLSSVIRARDMELNSINESLRDANQEKTKLVLRTTHDLKAPFSGMQSHISVLRMKYWTEISDDVKRIIERIELRAQTMSERIKDILILGELRSEFKKDPIQVTLDLQDLMKSIISDLSEKADERKVTVENNVERVYVEENEAELIILFSNLIANAIIYSREEGIVNISSEVDNDNVTIKITDHGIGIDNSVLPEIFKEYYRTSDAAQYNQQSTGLGLAIVKEVMEHLNLTIRVESEVSKGTVFYVMIPKTGRKK